MSTPERNRCVALMCRMVCGLTLLFAKSGIEVMTVDVTTDWLWEGNVVNALARSLASKGWTIESQADTHSKERGVDLRASKDGTTLLVEAKGYPSTSYRDPRRAAEHKPTNPVNQAQLKVLRLQSAHPQAKVALAFPDFPRYRALFGETKLALQKLGVAILFVNTDGEVSELGFN